jgi:hypothetical protein
MRLMRKLPVVPICRMTWPLRCRANQNEHPRIPPQQEGRIAIVTDVECGMRWTLHCQAHCARRLAIWRTAKSCGPGAPTLALRLLDSMSPTTDGGKKARFTGEITYKP